MNGSRKLESEKSAQGPKLDRKTLLRMIEQEAGNNGPDSTSNGSPAEAREN